MAKRNIEKEIPQSKLRELFSYDPVIGMLIWNVRPKSDFDSVRHWRMFNTQLAGKAAGSKDSRGYWGVTINYVRHSTHRIIWAWMTGEWPDVIDHIDGNKSNNKWSNLRNVNQIENSHNMRTSSLSKTGIAGVSWDASRKQWKAQIKVSGRRIFLGRFKNKTDAIGVRKTAERLHGFHPNHGRSAS